jgi:hypothetical protein
MKILGSVIVTAALTSSALVALPAAEAAPYPGTVATKVSFIVPGSVKRDRTIKTKVRARTTGNARVTGKILIRVYRVKKGHDPLVRQKTKAYSGSGYHKIGIRSIHTTGRYKARAWFLPSNRNSVFKKSHSGLKYFRVKR